MELLDRKNMLAMVSNQMKRLEGNGNADVQRLEKELQRTPKDAEVWFDLGLAYGQSALTYIDLAFEYARLEYVDSHPDLGPDDPVDISVEVPAAKGLFDKALDALNHVLGIDPEYYGLWTQIGTIYANMNRHQEAADAFLKALEDDPEDFSAAYYLACAYRDLGNEEQAQHYFSIAHELNPDDEAFCNCQGAPVEG